MKKLGAALAAAVLSAVAFTGCAPATDHGDVIDKEYSAPYTYMRYQCYTYKSDGQCAYGMWVNEHVSATYKVKVLDSTGTDAWLHVSPGEYESLELGEYYDAER